MVKIIIEVTKQNINAGERNDVGSCPIALAILAALPGSDVEVDGSEIKINDYTFKTPAVAERFIDRFDDEKKVKPFKFRLV